MESEIKKILNEAVYAPSGDNSQPWRFELKNNNLDIFSLPEKDNPIFNYRQRGTLIAHGALVENIVIISSHYGYKVNVEFLPYGDNLIHTARLIFESTNILEDPLFQFINKRSTNRKPYEEANLVEQQQKNFLDLNEQVSGVRIELVSRLEDKHKIGFAMGVNEIIMLRHKALHDFFYNDIRWTQAAEEKHKDGFYLKTLELKPPQLVIFKLLQYWPILKVLSILGLPEFIAKENGKNYGKAGAMLAVIVENKDEYFLKAGRIFQKAWLIATKNNLYMHPVTGIIYLAQPYLDGIKTEFSESQSSKIMNAYRDIAKCFDVQQGRIAMLLRVGEANFPSAKSLRKAPEIKNI